MARTLGAPERGPEDVDRRLAVLQPPRDLGREVHDVAVPLEGHHLVDLLRAELHHAADVVAGQVDEHHVLGQLLRVLAQLGTEAAVLLLGAAPAARSRDGAGDDRAVEELHHRLGRGADERHARLAHEVHVRARVHLAEHPVHVEGVSVEVEVEALGEHDLEDVAGEDVLARDLDGPPVGVAAHRRAHLGQRVVGIRGLDERLVEGTGPVGGELVEAGEGGVVASVELVVVEAGLDEHVLDERDPLAPVVVGGQLADDRHHGVGVAEVVRGDVGQALDLAHDVVAEVAHDPAVQRGQVLEGRGAPHAEQVLDAGEDATVERRAVGELAAGLDPAVSGGEGHERLAPDERPPAPPLAVLDGLEEEAGFVAHEPRERGDRGGEVGEELAPDRDHRVGAGEGPEVLPAGPRRHRWVIRRDGRSRCAHRCGRRPCPPARR
jgi:hypothetical protein